MKSHRRDRLRENNLMEVLLLEQYCLHSQLCLKYCYRSNRVRGTITSGFKQPKCTKQRSARWVYSQSARSIDLVLRARWQNCDLLSDVKSHEGGLHMPRSYTVSISIVESPVIPISIHSALGTARERHIVPGARGSFVFVDLLSMTVAYVVVPLVVVAV